LLHKSNGYTFIELLLAVTLLALITTPMLTLFVTALSAVHSAGQQTTAVNLCRAAMESVKAAGYDAAYETFIIEALSPIVESSLPGAANFRRVTEVISLTPESGPLLHSLEILHIRITVYWPGQGRERYVVLESYLAPR